AGNPVNVIASQRPALPQVLSESDYTPANAIEYVCRVIPAKNALPTIAATTAATASHVHGHSGTFTNRSATLPGRGKC
ncbi:hypothetical protein O0J73_22025, partial [Stenotrophomonas sp. Sm6012]|uniref:hypothetical protein n=1 Tax=Stenotrophomonas sp. Sm6012 TaxID=3002745 RepID=UPI0027E58475